MVWNGGQWACELLVNSLEIKENHHTSICPFHYLQKDQDKIVIHTWSWWSKKVFTHALVLASHTFTLLSDELQTTRTKASLYCKIQFRGFFIYLFFNILTLKVFWWLPGDKVCVIRWKGHVEHPRRMATQSACQVSMLSVTHTHLNRVTQAAVQTVSKITIHCSSLCRKCAQETFFLAKTLT